MSKNSIDNNIRSKDNLKLFDEKLSDKKEKTMVIAQDNSIQDLRGDHFYKQIDKFGYNFDNENYNFSGDMDANNMDRYIDKIY